MKNKIRKYVEKSGKTVGTIVKEAQISRSTFYAILNGEQVPRIDTAIRIAQALEVDIADAFPFMRGGYTDHD